MFQPIMIYLKSGEVGFCTLKYSDVTDLKNQVDSLSMSDDVDKVVLESHLPVLEMEKIREALVGSRCEFPQCETCSSENCDDRQRT